MFNQPGNSVLGREEEPLCQKEQKPAGTERILGRHLARELTAEEVEAVAGGAPCDDEDYDKCTSTFPTGDCDCYA